MLCVLGGRKRIGFGRTLCLMIRYPRIFAELCVWCEQFVNVRKKTPFSAKFSFTDIFFHIRLGSIPEKRHFRPLLPMKAVPLSTASLALVLESKPAAALLTVLICFWISSTNPSGIGFTSLRFSAPRSETRPRFPSCSPECTESCPSVSRLSRSYNRWPLLFHCLLL